MNLTQSEFIDIAKENACDPRATLDAILASNPNYTVNITQIASRIGNYRKQGLLPLDSGVQISLGEVLRGTTTTYDSNGLIKRQSVRTEVPKYTRQLDAIEESIRSLAETLPAVPEIPSPKSVVLDDLATLYISNDLHFGLMCWEPEVGIDWDTSKATEITRSAYDYLFENTPSSKVGIVCDLGDLTEADNFENLTPKGGNPLDTDSRYPKVLRAAHQALTYAVKKALEKHEIVYFYNISGNHDKVTAHAVREVIVATFADNPRVIVCDSPSSIKYHQHGKTLLGFAHGDGLKMNRAGETMAVDNHKILSDTEHRFFHFGHTHVDAVKDTALCRCESHRNIIPLNEWAYTMGFRRGCGTMKAITYSGEKGEISRHLFNV